MYGQTKTFETSSGPINAASRAEAAARVRGMTGRDPEFVRRPKFTTSLRGESKGNRHNPDVTYAGTRVAVRRLNGRGR